MKLQKKLWALGVVIALFTAAIGFFMSAATATTTPVWEPDSQAVGTLTFYDASGNVVTGGSDLTNLFTYAAANSANAARPGTTKAYLSYAFPKHGVTPGSWFATASTGATNFPVTTAPVPVKNITFPVTTTTLTGAANLTPVLGQSTFDTTAGYDNTLQVRLGDSGGGQPIDSTTYWDADILINQAAGTWQQIYPTPVAGPTSTTTTLAPSVASPQAHGTSITFTATVAPAAAGSVIFSDNGSAISGSVAVTAGHATLITSTLAVGSHSLTAAFTPTDPTAFSGSTSSALPYTITSSAATTTTSMSVTPTSPITAGTGSTLSASVSPSSAVGSIQFFDGSTPIGSAVALSGGMASLPHTFAAGSYSLKATFTPTDPTAFTGSSSTPQSYQVNPPATPTTTTLGIAPASPQIYGTTLTYTATVSPSAAGTVNFLDGATLIGSSAVSSGTAMITNSTLGAGTHSITAQFVPTSPASFQTSTSAVNSYTITKKDSTVSLVASPTSTAEQGATVGLTATVGPAGVGGGSVQFYYLVSSTPTAIGSPVTVSGTTAHTTTSTLPLTTTGLRAVFTPSSANYNASAPSDVAFSVTLPPPGSTTTGLTVTPTGPVAQGTVETLHATVTPAGAAGMVAFMDGASIITSVAVSGGTASTTTTLAVGTHDLTAAFLPTNSALYTGSASTSVSYQVLPPATVTTTTLAIGPGSSEPYGTLVSFTANVSPSAAGSVTFKDGATVLGSSAVSSGVATFSTSALHGGSHSITAQFVPTSPLLFAGSTSAPSALTITAVSTTTSLTINPIGPVSHGASVTVSATVSPSTAPGSVAFYNGATLIGSATVVAGHASLTTKLLPIGVDSITGTFTSAHAGDFDASASVPVTISVLSPPTIASVFANGKPLAAGGKTVAGATLQIHAQGFQPNETITVNVHSATIKIGTATASSTGFAVVTVKLPTSLALGTHTLSLVGSVGTATFSFVVAKASSGTGGSGGGLANTGANAQIGIVTGLLMLTSGLMLIGVARRRGGVRG